MADPPVESESTRNVLTTTQWLSVISIFVSLMGVYYKREEIKAFLTKKPPQLMSPLNLSISRLKEKEASARWLKD